MPSSSSASAAGGGPAQQLQVPRPAPRTRRPAAPAAFALARPWHRIHWGWMEASVEGPFPAVMGPTVTGRLNGPAARQQARRSLSGKSGKAALSPTPLRHGLLMAPLTSVLAARSEPWTMNVLQESPWMINGEGLRPKPLTPPLSLCMQLWQRLRGCAREPEHQGVRPRQKAEASKSGACCLSLFLSAICEGPE